MDRHIAAHELDKSEEHPQIQIIFRNSQLGLTFDCFVVGQKLPQYLGTIGISSHISSLIVWISSDIIVIIK